MSRNPHDTPSALPHQVRCVTGLAFILAGAFKLALPLLPDAPSFGSALQELSVPFAGFFGWAIPLLEIGGGVALLRQRGILVSSILLIGDMLAAIGLVGWPGISGHTLHWRERTIGAEPWRLPLEITLLLMLSYLAQHELSKPR